MKRICLPRARKDLAQPSTSPYRNSSVTSLISAERARARGLFIPACHLRKEGNAPRLASLLFPVSDIRRISHVFASDDHTDRPPTLETFSFVAGMLLPPHNGFSR